MMLDVLYTGAEILLFEYKDKQPSGKDWLSDKVHGQQAMTATEIAVERDALSTIEGAWRRMLRGCMRLLLMDGKRCMRTGAWRLVDMSLWKRCFGDGKGKGFLWRLQDICKRCSEMR